MPHLPISNFDTTHQDSFGTDLDSKSTMLDGVFASKLPERYVSQEEKDQYNPPERKFTGYIKSQVSSKRISEKDV